MRPVPLPRRPPEANGGGRDQPPTPAPPPVAAAARPSPAGGAGGREAGRRGGAAPTAPGGSRCLCSVAFRAPASPQPCRRLTAAPAAAKTPRAVLRVKNGAAKLAKPPAAAGEAPGGAPGPGLFMERSQSRLSLSASFEALAIYFPCMNSFDEEDAGTGRGGCGLRPRPVGLGCEWGWGCVVGGVWGPQGRGGPGGVGGAGFQCVCPCPPTGAVGEGATVWARSGWVCDMSAMGLGCWGSPLGCLVGFVCSRGLGW